MADHDISFLKAFNAKEMPDKEVAKTFVSSQKFSQLAGSWNSLILGPRGSGKTTLLKMLRLPALRMWAGREADRYRSEINFTGVFVPADITWSEMIEALGRKKLAPDVQESVVQCVFCTNVLLSLIEAFEARITPTIDAIEPNYRCAQYVPSRLNSALSSICSLWLLKLNLISLSGIKSALQSRLLLIQAEVAREVRQITPSRDSLEQRLPFLYLHTTTAVEVAVEQFDHAIEDPNGRWALLFDEFEIAPIEIQSMIFHRFRSAGNRLLYKVGLAPCTSHTIHSLETVGRASEGNDYKQIELWYPDKKSAIEFSNKIFDSIKRNSENILLSQRTAREIFGENHFIVDDSDSIEENDYQPYGKGERWREVFESLKGKDKNFREYLIRKGIDTGNLETAPGSPTGNTIRKIAPLVAFRDAFQRVNNNSHKRGRKKLNFAYSGWEAISAICEGNPRWLIGIINMIISAGQHDLSSIKPSIQVDKITKATESFSAMLSTVATHQAQGLKTDESIDKLIREIGNYFFDRLVNDDFMEEPPLSFSVDKKVSPEKQNALRIAINHGAIINIPNVGEFGARFESLEGKRFRLAYLLAPRFKLPLRATKEVALSTILSSEKLNLHMANQGVQLPLL